MNYQFISGEGLAPVKAWINGVEVDENTVEQVKKTARLPFVRGVALMPDCHVGIGSTVGSVIATTGAVIPSCCGVDIGCGVQALMTSLTASDLPLSLSNLRSAIEEHVPHGRTDNGGVNDRGAWGEPPDFITPLWEDQLSGGLAKILEKHPKLGRAAQRAPHHLSTLGTGNHFIEMCLDTEDHVWVMLHSGSRGIGNAIGSHFIDLAKKDMKRWFINLPDISLAYLPEGTEHFKDYVEALYWAQSFASINRELMMQRVLRAIKTTLGRHFEADLVAISCHHNYVSRENHGRDNVWVTRKGAVRARKDDLGIIPGSMGAASYIVRGKGNKDSFESCSHGAGRRMSRGEAKRSITLKQHRVDTAHVECRKDADVLDESPAAYKDIANVMAAQSDLVEVVYTLKQILNVKG